MGLSFLPLDAGVDAVCARIADLNEREEGGCKQKAKGPT